MKKEIEELQVQEYQSWKGNPTTQKILKALDKVNKQSVKNLHDLAEKDSYLTEEGKAKMVKCASIARVSKDIFAILNDYQSLNITIIKQQEEDNE